MLGSGVLAGLVRDKAVTAFVITQAGTNTIGSSLSTGVRVWL
jgi:hypothetical protein